jgi:hypothetical protein
MTVQSARTQPRIAHTPGFQATRRVMWSLAQPWFDSTALWAMSRWYLPLSRAWAAASVADGSVERFQRELPIERINPAARFGLSRALHRTAALQSALRSAEAHWEQVFFAPQPVAQSALFNAERRRRQASHAYMFARSGFALLRLGADYPCVRYEIPSPDRTATALRDWLDDPTAAYLPRELPKVEVSQRLEHPKFSEYWLRFPSLDAKYGNFAWAHVREPNGVIDPPSLVHVHGLGVEFESLDGVEDDVDPIVAMGVRLVRLEALWHNRRRLPGHYGGESFLSRQPVAGIELMQAVAREAAVLVSWCRSTSRGRIAIGGTSMGALSTQLVACRAHEWPKAMIPDALWLVTTSDDLGGLAFNSSLAKAVRLPDELTKAGWTPEGLAMLNPLVAIDRPPAMAPEDIVVVLGQRDDVTPYSRGAAMVAGWNVPEQNVFHRALGHFSVPLGLLGDQGPLLRLVARLHTGSRS